MSPLDLRKRLNESDAWLADFYAKVKSIISQTMSIIVRDVPRRKGQFTMLGLDIMASADGSLFLLEVNQSPELSEGNRMPWRKAFQKEMLAEVVDIQWALLEARRQTGQCSPSASEGTCPADATESELRFVTRTTLAAARRFEPLWLESSENSKEWAYHSADSKDIDESEYPSRLSYLDSLL